MLKLEMYATKTLSVVYASDTVLKGICLTILLKQNETKFENKTPREIMKWTEKQSSEDCSEVSSKLNGVPALQEKQLLAKQQILLFHC